MKQLRETMTESAFSIDCIMHNYNWVGVESVAREAMLSVEEAAFILEQMICKGIAIRNSAGRYSLTHEYRTL